MSLYSTREIPTSGQYFYGNQKRYAQSSSDYSSLGAYNAVSGQFATGPPILSETKIQIIPSYGGVGYSPQRSMNPGANYFGLNDAYCCGQSTCQSVTQPIYGNIVKSVYGKQTLPQMQVPLKYQNF
jgi:hypothetical protein